MNILFILLFATYHMCYLVASQDQSSPQCFLTLINHTKHSDSMLERDIIEYRVKYRYGSNDTVSDLSATSLINSTRFQPWRWFNVNEKAFPELQMMYDNIFHTMRQFIDVQHEIIEVLLEPEQCIQESNVDILEEETRNFLMQQIHPPNSRTCTAHIVNKDGTGSVSFKCCKPSEKKCEYYSEGRRLRVIHTLSIVITVFIFLCVIGVHIQPKLGIDEFYFYPDYMKILFTTVKPDGIEKTLELCRLECCNIFPEIDSGEDNINVVKTVKRIRLSVNKRKCCNESYARVSFKRCLREFISDFNSSYLRPKRGREEESSCFESSCFESSCFESSCFESSCFKSSCCLCIRIIFKRIVSLLPSIILLALILYFNFKQGDWDFKHLCNAYKQKGFDCPFYTSEYLHVILYYWSICYGIFCAFFIFQPYSYVTKFICELKQLKTYSLCKTKGENCNCFDRCCFRIFINIMSLLVLYITWGLIIFYVVYFLIRTILVSRNTKNIYDNLCLAVFPFSLVVIEKLMDVTQTYAFYTQNIINLLHRGDIHNPSRSGQSEESSIAPETIKLKKYQQNENSENFTFSKKSGVDEKEGALIHPESDPTADLSFENYCCRLNLKINRPLIFLQPRERYLISRRLVSLMYSENNCCRLEINNYLKAAAWSVIPCFIFGVLFFLILKYGTLYSYSTEVADYTLMVLTVVKWLESKITSSIKANLGTDNTLLGLRFQSDLKYTLENFEESWTVSGIEFEDEHHNQQPVNEEAIADNVQSVAPEYTHIFLYNTRGCKQHCCSCFSFPLLGLETKI